MTKDILDVIKAVEICKDGEGGCANCPYFKSDGKHACYAKYGNNMLKDVLYYLKKYKKGLTNAAS